VLPLAPAGFPDEAIYIDIALPVQEIVAAIVSFLQAMKGGRI
jgi:hypothetical protein